MSTSAEGWLRTSRYIKTRRPAPRVLLIALSNPPYNLLNGDMLYELSRVLTTLSMRETGAVIITSAVDDVFLNHYDMQEFLDLVNAIPIGSSVAPSVVRGALYAESFLAAIGLRRVIERTPLAGLSYLNSFYELTNLLRSIPQITIAAINGRALGSGAELSLACDFRIMVESDGRSGQEENIFGQPEITLGLIPGGGGTQMLTHLVGPAKALEISLMKPFLTAKEAQELGLVTKIVPHKQIIPEAVQLAVQLAKRSPIAVAAIKDCVYIGAAGPLASGMRREQGNLGVCALVPESREALTQYNSQIESFLGPKSSMQDYRQLETGEFVDFIPNSWQMAARQKQEEQRRLTVKQGIKDGNKKTKAEKAA